MTNEELKKKIAEGDRMDEFVAIMYWRPTRCPVCGSAVIKGSGSSDFARCLGEDDFCPFHEWTQRKYWLALQKVRDKAEELIQTIESNLNRDWGDKVKHIAIPMSTISTISKESYELYKALYPEQRSDSEKESEKNI